MANTKRVYIAGTVPFDIAENDELCLMLGACNGPAFGLRITYGNDPFMKTIDGGRTAMYPFTMEGVEAVSNKWLRRFVELVKEVGGTVNGADVYDMDGEEKISLV